MISGTDIVIEGPWTLSDLSKIIQEIRTIWPNKITENQLPELQPGLYECLFFKDTYVEDKYEDMIHLLLITDSITLVVSGLEMVSWAEEIKKKILASRVNP